MRSRPNELSDRGGHKRFRLSSNKTPIVSMQTQPEKHTKNLSADELHRVVSEVLLRADGGVPKRGALKEVADLVGVHVKTVARVWKRAKAEFERTGVYKAESRKHQCCRRPGDHSEQLEALRGVDLPSRSTIRSGAAACGMSPTTFFRQIKRGNLRSHTSVAKPLLTDDNKTARFAYCMSHIDRHTLLFNDMNSFVHVDEKTFTVTEAKRRVYLLHGETLPARKLKSKRYITKVMMLAAVGRPRWHAATQSMFDGKLGIWAFVLREPAIRSSARRSACTMVTKECSVTKTTYREKLVQDLLPALRDRWPWSDDGSGVIIHQDNAPPHINLDDAEVKAAVDQLGRGVELRFQPPNSPDLNVPDLGVFNAVQAQQRKKKAKTIDELIAAGEDDQ